MEENTNGKSMNPMMVVGVVVLLLVLGGGFMLIRGSGNGSQTTTETTNTTNDASSATPSPESAEAEPGTGEVKVINLEAGSFYFTPNEIKVKKGERVKIVMTSKDMMHDFVIDDLNVKIPVTRAGSTATVEFTAGTVGEFEYYCSVGNHRAQGQVGKLIVE